MFPEEARSVEPAYTSTSTGGFATATISLGTSGDQTVLSLFGTGLAGASAANTSVTINGVSATVLYSGPQGSVPGLDQVNIQIPASLAGKGNVNVRLTSSGVVANPVQITVR